MKFNLRARLTAEFLGSAFLVAAVIGSGIMGERLAGGNVAIALLANTIATGAALVALLLTLGPISGAHLNPAVTLADAMERGDSLARGSGLHDCAMLGRNCRSDHRAFDVWAALVFVFLTFAARVEAGPQRVGGNLRINVCDLGMFAASLRSRAVRGCELYHRRLLVHGVHLVCKPGSDHCALVV